MNIGIDTGPATLAGVGAAPSPREGAAPGASADARHAAHFQSLVEGRSRASRPATAKVPAGRDAARAKAAPHSASAAVGTTGPIKTAGVAEQGFDTVSAYDDAVAAAGRASTAAATLEDDSTKVASAGSEGASDSDLLSLMGAMFGLPAPAPIALPSQPTSQEPESDSTAGGGNTVTSAPTARSEGSLDDQALQQITLGTPIEADAAGSDRAGAPVFDPAAAPRSAPTQTAPGSVALGQTSTVAPVPSAAGRALARALGALTPATPAAGQPSGGTVVAGGSSTTRAATSTDGTDEPAATATKRSAAPHIRAAAIQAMPEGLAMTQPQFQDGEGRPTSVDGVLRQASAAVLGRQLASAAGWNSTDVTAPPGIGAPIAGGVFRIEGLAVPAAQGAQQASIGLAPAVSDPATTREGTVAEQLVKAIRIQVRDGIGEAKMSLRPDHMGEVSIQLRVDKERVSATLVVERSDVRAQIEAQGSALRSGLEAQGLHLEELVVREDGERRKGQGHEDRREQSGKRRRQGGDQTFDLDDA